MKCANTRSCSCPKTSCANYGVCCACVEAHRAVDSLPSCLRSIPNAKPTQK